MPKATLIEVLLHPRRLKIVTALIGLGPSTAHEIAAAMRPLPQATLYRELRLLTDSQILSVVEEHRIRGTVERVYSVNVRRLNPARDGGHVSLEMLNLEGGRLAEFSAEMTALIDRYRATAPAARTHSLASIVISAGVDARAETTTNQPD